MAMKHKDLGLEIKNQRGKRVKKFEIDKKFTWAELK